MKTRSILLIGAALGAIGLATLLWVFLPQPFSYQGKSVTDWSGMLNAPDTKAREKATAAIHEMGTNALRPLIQQLRARESGLKSWWRSVLVKLNPSYAQALARNTKFFDASGLHASAAMALALLGTNTAPAVPALAVALRDSDAWVRWESAKALGAIGEASVPALTNALRDSRFDVRHPAAFSLGVIGTNAVAAVPAMITALMDSNKEVRGSTLYAIGQVGIAARPALLSALGSQRGLNQLQIAAVLIRLGGVTRDLIPVVEQGLHHPDPAVRARAAELAGNFRPRDPRFVPLLIAMLDAPEPIERLAAAKALRNAYDRAAPAITRLTILTQDPDAEMRETATWTLASLGTNALPALPALQQRLMDESAPVRLAATNALRLINPVRPPE